MGLLGQKLFETTVGLSNDIPRWGRDRDREGSFDPACLSAGRHTRLKRQGYSM